MKYKLSDADWGAFARAAEIMGNAAKDAGLSIQKAGQALRALRRPIIQLVETHFLDNPMPGEEPVDYVMRVGARSGFFIYPDEAWRYRANLDWWNERKQKGEG